MSRTPTAMPRLPRLQAALALLCAVAGPACASSAGPVVVDVRARAEVANAEVTLADVAQLHGGDAASRQALAVLPLGPAPAPGDEVRLARQRLAAWLGRQRQVAAQWSLAGAPEVVVTRATQAIDGTEVVEQAQHAVDAWLQARATRHAAVPVQSVARITYPAGALQLQVRPFAHGLQPAARMQVWVDLRVDQRLVRSIPVAFQVQASRPGWTLARDVKAGQVLAAADLAATEVDLTRQGAPAAADATVGRSLRRPLQAGQVVLSAHLDMPPAIGRGTTIALHSKAGIISMTTTALALQEGHAGQRILVKPSGATRPVEAQVTGAGRAEVLQ